MYWYYCAIDPFSHFACRYIHPGSPKCSQCACVPCFYLCDVLCHVPLLLRLLLAEFHCTILAPCLHRVMCLPWLEAQVSVIYTRSTGKSGNDDLQMHAHLPSTTLHEMPCPGCATLQLSVCELGLAINACTATGWVAQYIIHPKKMRCIRLQV